MLQALLVPKLIVQFLLKQAGAFQPSTNLGLGSRRHHFFLGLALFGALGLLLSRLILVLFFRILPELGDGVVEVGPDVLAQLLPEGAQRLGVVLVHRLPEVLVFPGLVDEVVHLNQDAEIKFGRFAVGLFLGNDRLGFFVGLAEVDEAGLHLVEVIDLLAVADGLDDGVEGLVPLLFGRPDNSLRVLLVVAELIQKEKRRDIKLIGHGCSFESKITPSRTRRLFFKGELFI